jgi:hypothetical protein
MPDKQSIRELEDHVSEMGDALARELLSRDPATLPEAVTSLVRDYHEIDRLISETRDQLKALVPLIETSRERDQSLLAAEAHWGVCRDALIELALPFARVVSHAAGNGEIQPDEVIQPLLDEAQRIATMRGRLEQAAAGDGMWERGKLQAEKLMLQGKLKLAELEHEATLKEVGVDILRHTEEEVYRHPSTGAILDQIAALRPSLESARLECLKRKQEQSDFHHQAAVTLGLDAVNSTADLTARHQAWSRSLSDAETRLRQLPARILEAALADDPFRRDNSQIQAILAGQRDLRTIGRKRLVDLDPISPVLARSLLGNVLREHRQPINLLNGIPQCGTAPMRLSAHEQGLSLARIADRDDTVFGILSETIAEITLEDHGIAHEPQHANLVAKGLMGFVTGGVRGAVMQGVGALQSERTNPLPDLKLRIHLRHPDTGSRVVTFNVAGKDDTVLKNFFLSAFPDPFRVIALRTPQS